MTMHEQIRQKFEEFKFDTDKFFAWLFAQQSTIEKKKKAFFILITFPEY